MTASTALSLLACPHCGEPLDTMAQAPAAAPGFGSFTCGCASWPLVDGVPILRLDDRTAPVSAAVASDDPDEALRTALGVGEREWPAIVAAAAEPALTSIPRLLSALLPSTDAVYFRFRFGDPTFTLARALAEGLLDATASCGRPVLDVCGGAGHLAWALAARSRRLGLPAPLMLEGDFRLAWISRRLVPGAVAACCDANLPLPVEGRAFGLVVCADALHYVWNRRLLASELMRATAPQGALLATHLHNLTAWSPSPGLPLTAGAWRRLFADATPRVLPDRPLLRAVVGGRALGLDQTREDTLAGAPSVTVVAGAIPAELPAAGPGDRAGVWRLHPLYHRLPEPSARGGEEAAFALEFPSSFYEDEFGELLRDYLPDRISLSASAADDASRLAAERPDLVRCRVIIDAPHVEGGRRR